MNEKVRIVAAGALGNVLEWYDFGLYGLMAPVLASLFFPGHSRMAGLLEVYGGFAAGFAMRPLGAVVLGQLGDRRGRRFVLLLSVILMGAATVAVGLLPTYAEAGVWAPVLLIAIRLAQGFSVGGEFVDSVTYLVESSSQKRRGLAGSVANVGSTAGMLLAAAVAALMLGWGRVEHGNGWAAGWGWRVPFLLGGVIACAAYLLRRHLPETAVAAAMKEEKPREAPLRQAVRRQPWILLAALLFTSGYGIADYVSMVFLPTYAHEFGHVAEGTALSINTAGQALALFVVPLAAWVSDRAVTRRTLLAVTFLAEAALAWEAFRLAGHGGVAGLWAAQLSLAFLLAVVMGNAPAMLAEQFEPGYRVSAHAVVFNLGIGIAGGTAPMVAMGLIRVFSNAMAPAVYLIGAAALSAVSVLGLREYSRRALD